MVQTVAASCRRFRLGPMETPNGARFALNGKPTEVRVDPLAAEVQPEAQSHSRNEKSLLF